MSTTTLFEIADELNRRATDHPIGTLQEIRGHRPGVDLFRLNAKTMQERWACHWGGRTELQFNIGIEESPSKLRYGVAFSFQESREYKPDELVKVLRPKVTAFNRFLKRNSSAFADMCLWAWDNNNGVIAYDADAAPIPERLVSENYFVFMGKYQSVKRINYEGILDDFDRLLPLYQYVEGHAQNDAVSVPLETHFAFRPGCRTKKRSAIVRKCREQIEMDLRHNALQKALHRRLAREFGKDYVGTEVKGKNGTSIDLVVKRKHGFWFYEIKTMSTARGCIREALGQILEYSFWPGAQEAVRLVIAGEGAMNKEDEDYLRCLKKRFSLPLEYEQITA